MSPSASNTALTTSVPLPQEVILNVERGSFLGLFRIPINQINPHPLQRAISVEWINNLKEHLEKEGIDKAAHPVKVLLDGDQEKEELLPTGVHSSIPLPPEDLHFLVFDGQHRLEACRQLNNPDERWWFAKVYRKALETDHPAEFLSLMHAGNESQVRLKARDVDRFIGVHRLRLLFHEQRIDKNTFETNRSRLMGPNESVRRGLANLTKSIVLSTAVFDVLQHPQLRGAFSPAAWRKLTTGRFYDLVTWILDEMMAQCLLLMDNGADVPSQPFSLSARLCDWDNLSSAIRSKDHSWSKLPGGALVALERVRNCPTNYTTPLTKASGNRWTFENTLLLPSVLTSQTVLGPLNEMNRIAQHLVHIIAGPKALDRYTSPQGQKGDDDHPVGFIYQVLGARALKPDGTRGSYPHKIIIHIWINRSQLLEDLNTQNIEQANDTSEGDYEGLIHTSKAWWALLRMFRTKSFSEGLPITIPKEFGLRPSEPVPPEEPQAQQGISESLSHQDPVQPDFHRSPSGQPENNQEATSLDTHAFNQPTSTSAMDEQPDTSGGTGITGRTTMPTGMPLMATTQGKPTPRGQKRGWESEEEEEEEEEDDFRLRPGIKEARELQSGQDEWVGHRGLNHQIQVLSERSWSMGRPEASAFALLIESLSNVENNVLCTVANSLRREIPRLEAKAKRAAKASYDDGEEDGETDASRNDSPMQEDDERSRLNGDDGEAGDAGDAVAE